MARGRRRWQRSLLIIAIWAVGFTLMFAMILLYLWFGRRELINDLPKR